MMTGGQSKCELTQDTGSRSRSSNCHSRLESLILIDMLVSSLAPTIGGPLAKWLGPRHGHDGLGVRIPIGRASLIHILKGGQFLHTAGFLELAHGVIFKRTVITCPPCID